MTGTCTPLKFDQKDGKEWAKGVLEGVVTSPDGGKQTFTALRSMTVKSIDGQQLTGSRVAGKAFTRQVLERPAPAT